MAKQSELKLNPAQQAVVDHQNGPLLVVAGAGTGKTRVIVKRINRLLDEGVEAKAILAVTFTEKAAAEMLERVMERRGGYLLELPIMTFNAFGESLLREFNTDIGLNRNFLLMGDNAKVVFLRQHLAELELDYYSPISNPEGLLPDIADYFSRLKQHVITPEVYDSYVSQMPSSTEAEQLEKAKHRELTRAFGHYLDLCKQRSVIDYDDQIYRVIELLNNRPNIQSQLTSRYHTIMVDEFQDTNPMQSNLIDLLVGKTQNLMVVGDDDQSIYGFRGATLANILQFKPRYKTATEVTLTQNYRSSQQILDGAYNLIQNNNPNRLEASLKIDKKLRAQTTGADPLLMHFGLLDQELNWLTEDISKRLRSGEKPGDIAILCRRKITANLIAQKLELADIDYVVIGERYQLYQTEVVRMLVEALNAVINSSADTSLYHTLCGGLFNASAELMAELSAQAKRQHQPLSQLIESQTDEQYQTLQANLKLIRDWRRQAGSQTVGRLAYKIIDQTGYKERLLNDSLTEPDAAVTITQLAEFFKTLKEFESIALQPTTLQYIESFPVLEAAGESGEDGTLQVSIDKINILTIHKSKGLEWNTVYIPDCTEGSFPLRARGGGIQVPSEMISSSSSAADEHLAEERRLMYVALTRARQNLQLSFSDRHHSQTLRKPSRFLAEIFSDDAVGKSVHNQANGAQAGLDLFLQAPAKPNQVSVPRSIYDGTTVHLSVSQIDTYLRCPLDFYYRYVLNVPEEASSTASYGTTIHALIEAINRALISGQVIELADLESQFETLWVPEGYLSNDHARRAKKQALSTLRNFYRNHYELEKVVPHQVEEPFSVILQPEMVRLKGRLDVVFQTNEGIEIRDYKTSSTVTTPEKAKSRASGSDQLTLYALVWQELHGELPARLSLEFVDTNMIGYIKKTPRGIATMRSKIGEMAEAIKRNEFIPGKDHIYCRHPEI